MRKHPRQFPAPSRDGYVPYMIEPPPRNALVRFWNEYTGHRWTGNSDELARHVDVTPLWWSLTGIERERAA